MTHLTAELSVCELLAEHQVVSSCTVYLADSAVLFASEFSRNLTHRNEPGGHMVIQKRRSAVVKGVVRFELTNRMSNPMVRIVN